MSLYVFKAPADGSTEQSLLQFSHPFHEETQDWGLLEKLALQMTWRAVSMQESTLSHWGEQLSCTMTTRGK